MEHILMWVGIAVGGGFLAWLMLYNFYLVLLAVFVIQKESFLIGRKVLFTKTIFQNDTTVLLCQHNRIFRNLNLGRVFPHRDGNFTAQIIFMLTCMVAIFILSSLNTQVWLSVTPEPHIFRKIKMHKSAFLTMSLIAFSIGFAGCTDRDAPATDGTSQMTEANAMPAAGTKATDQSTGTIRGRVIYEGAIPRPQKLLVVKDVEICGKSQHFDEQLTVSSDHGIQNAVVSLVKVQGGKPLAEMGNQFVLDQKDCAYQPHTLIVPVNTPVQILNQDGILHNIHTFSSKNPPQNVAQPKFRKKLEMTFSTPEKIMVRCDVHGWMSAWIIVVDHPYCALTDQGGRFTLSGVPPGTYELNCWQEKLGEQKARVTVTAGQPAVVNFSYPTGKGRD